ncbi:hypothetical protein BGX38DRAFT_1276980 [Terfezia claveryi]|nr:hypothetical protein BGX38DRAFT_1276980 [Terfezia claveryi]
MAPRGQLNYDTDDVRQGVWTLCDDIAKKAWNCRQNMWEVIHRARAAHCAANPNPPVVEPRRWPLPDAQELGAPSTGPSYMLRNPRGRASVALQDATRESNTERDRRAVRRATVDAGVPALAQPRPPLPPRPPRPPRPPPSPGMQRIPILIPNASLPRQGACAGLIAGGVLAHHTCRRPVPAGGAPATAGPPTSIRIHIITPEDHVRDVDCGGWLFQPNTQSQTVTIHAHTMAELQLRCQPFLPSELGTVREIARYYVLDNTQRWMLLALRLCSNFWLGVHIIAGYSGGMMLDVQVEVKPPGLVRAPAGGGGGQGVNHEGQGAGPGAAHEGSGGDHGHPDAAATGGSSGSASDSGSDSD